MTGARQLARDYIAPMMTPGICVLDVGCGDKWVKTISEKVAYIGIDKPDFDLTKDGWWDHRLVGPDLIVSCYALQHLLSEEARVWTLLRRIAKPETKFVYVGRYAEFCCREEDRADPLNGYDEAGFRGLALASGWRVAEFKGFVYSGEKYSTPFYVVDSNAFCSTLEPV